MDKLTYVIDGATFSTLEGFYDATSTVLIPGVYWGRNLDAFDDILGGGFGTTEAGFVLVWKNSDLSRACLGYPETVRYLEQRVRKCHPSNVPRVREELARAKQGEGATLFDWLVQIIEDNAAWGVELRLE